MTVKLEWPAKYSDEVLDYEVDWNAELEDGDAITGTVEVEATNDVVVDTNETTAGVTRLRLSGGTGVRSRIDLLANTTSGQKIGARIALPIIERA